jgi:hypothetical protein
VKKRNQLVEYYCVAVRRNYEAIWRMVSQHDTPEAAQAELNERHAYTGAFNYNNADLRVISRSEAKKEFGADWEYTPIGLHKKKVTQDT